MSVPNFSAGEVETDGEAGDGLMRLGRKVEQAEPEFFRAFCGLDVDLEGELGATLREVDLAESGEVR